MKNSIKTLVQEHIRNAGDNRGKGLATFANQVTELVESKETALTLEQVRLRPLMEAMLPEETDFSNTQEVAEAMAAAGFPNVVGTLIHPLIMKQYEPLATPILSMVTEVESKSKEENHVGFGAMDNFELVRELAPYEGTEPRELLATIANNKFGRTISVSMEMVMFDKTGQVLTRAGRIGYKAGLHLHKMVVQKACSLACTATGEAANKSLITDGTSRTMYADTHASWDFYANDNLSTTAFSSDGLITVLALKDALYDDKGEAILWMPKILLVNPALEILARQVTKSEYEFDGAAARNFNPFYNAYTVIASPFVDSATAWYIGDFALQTLLQWVYKLRTESKRNNSDAAFSNDIVAEFKAGYFCGVGCTDYRYVIKGKA
jgi:hypothetical protein